MVIIKTMKRGLFFIGIGFLALAFISGASEIAAQGVSRQLRMYMPIVEVWEVLSPETLEQFRNDGISIFASNWRTVEMFMLLPGWLLFGVPGIFLALVFRDRDAGPGADHEESIFLYDELAKRANEEGMSEDFHGDDVMPSSHVRTEPAGLDMADEHIEIDDDNYDDEAKTPSNNKAD